MNIANLIKGQWTTGATEKLARLLGTSESETSSALSAAVPGLLATMAASASNSLGAEKLVSSLTDLAEGLPSSADQWLGQDPAETFDQGGSLLGALFSGNTIGELAESLGRFSGMEPSCAQKQLGYLAPIVIGIIAKQLSGNPTVEVVQDFFADQQSQIQNAMPAGFQLVDIPNADALDIPADDVTERPFQRSAADTAVREPADDPVGASRLSTLIPVAILALLGLLGWQFLRGAEDGSDSTEVAELDTSTDETYQVQRPVIDASQTYSATTEYGERFRAIYADAGDALEKIGDLESARQALPKLQQLDQRIGDLVSARGDLTASAQATINRISTNEFGELREMIDEVLQIPGVEPILQPVLRKITEELASFAGTDLP